MKTPALIICLALAAAVAAPVHAADASAAMTTQQVLDRMAEALGGRDALSQARVLHLQYEGKAYGLDGTIDQWVDAAGRTNTHVNLGGIFDVLTVFDRDHGWFRDQNGKLSELGGEDLEQEFATAYDLTWSFLLDGRMVGSATFDGVEDATGALVLRLAPKGGKAYTYYLDATTFLPVRTETPVGDRTQTVTFGEWKAFDDIMMPTHQLQSRGDPQYDANFDLKSMDVNATPPAGAFDKPVEEASGVTFTDGAPVRDIPIEFNAAHIFMQASVEGAGVERTKPLWFILDTGASATVLNTDVARDLGFDLQGKVEGRGAGSGSVDVSFIPDVSVSLPGVTLAGQTLVSVPLADVEARSGRAIDGILGYDFISRFVVEIDYHARTLTLYDRNQFQYAGDGSVIPITLPGSSPEAGATIAQPGREPVTANFLIDTGANATVIFTRPFGEEHDLASGFGKSFVYVGGFGVGGESSSTVSRLGSITMGDVTFDAPSCALSHDEGGALADPNIAGLIGGLLLRQCRVFFDYEHQRMILERGPDFGKPFEIDWSGLILKTGGRGDFHTFTVMRALDDSPAKDAGIKEGDVIVSADGTPAAELTTHMLWEKFQNAGTTVKLTLMRDGKEKKVELKLKRRV